jgi:hypothetical protein
MDKLLRTRYCGVFSGLIPVPTSPLDGNSSSAAPALVQKGNSTPRRWRASPGRPIPRQAIHEILIEKGFAKGEDVLILCEEFGMELVDLAR